MSESPPIPDAAAHASSADRSLRCGKCGFNLFGIATDGRCPECGQAVFESIVPEILTLPSMGHLALLKLGFVFFVISQIGFLLIHILRTFLALHLDQWEAAGEL